MKYTTSIEINQPIEKVIELFDNADNLKRHMERELYAPMLRGAGVRLNGWNEMLANDYCKPHHHISLTRAIGRRLRRNYAWVLSVQALAYLGKLIIHPDALQSWAQLWERAAVGLGCAPRSRSKP